MEARITDKPAPMDSVKRTYSYDGERGGYAVTRSERGWVVETWSRVQGERTGRRVLVPYFIADGSACSRQGQDPDFAINDTGTTYAQWLLHMADAPASRVLRSGWTGQEPFGREHPARMPTG